MDRCHWLPFQYPYILQTIILATGTMKTFNIVAAVALSTTAVPLVTAFLARPLPIPSATTTTTLNARKKAAGSDDDAKAASSSSSSSSSMNPAKRAALDGVLNQIERSYGRGSIVKLGDAGNMVVESISTGALTLDAALGGGFPKGRVVEIYGPESSGKTTLALHAIAECQKAGGTAAFVDAEHALDPSYGELR